MLDITTADVEQLGRAVLSLVKPISSSAYLALRNFHDGWVHDGWAIYFDERLRPRIQIDDLDNILLIDDHGGLTVVWCADPNFSSMVCDWVRESLIRII